jgi:hypothetical protein
VANLTIQDLGSLGELIAAIATIATLVYLARQIGQNAKSVQASSAQSLMHLEVSTFALVAQHAEVYQRGNTSVTDLNPVEEVVYEQLVSAVMSLMVSGFIQYQNGLIQDFDTYLADWRNVHLKSPGFQAAWAKVRHGYPDDFRQCLDSAGKPADGPA